MNSTKKIAEFYKGFVIVLEENEISYSVAYSDIHNIIGIDLIKAEIDRNLANTNKQVATYRGIPINRIWQNEQIIIREGKEMVDNGFYYQIPIHPFNGSLYTSLDDLCWSIDRTVQDRDDFYKKQFPVEYKQFMKLINC